MGEKMLVSGNEAVGWGAINADCFCFFGYPITPQNETTEWFARELPERGGIFLQAESETSAINMIYGAAATGARALTSTSSPGWSLMQETMSILANAEVPCVVVLVQRGGPAQGTTRHAQMDYLSATKGGGHGGYRNIVLAPNSVQETHDHVQLAFYLADKYRNPVVVLSDGIVGQAVEPLEVKAIDFGPLPEKNWALAGMAQRKDGERRLVSCAQGFMPNPPYNSYLELLQGLDKKFRDIATAEVKYETHQTEDADLVLVAYGYASRVCQEVMSQARAEGLKVGLLRPITLWPFPLEATKAMALRGAKFLVVEDSLGLMIEDVQWGTQGQAEVHLTGALVRHMGTEMGMILPHVVLEEVRKLL